ncbi:ORF6N domain-containing protein [Patescibacteria group bacterium]
MSKNLIPQERIMDKIFYIRGKKIILDKDIAKLYGVETKVLNQAIRRNIKRFPIDFMFQLTNEEFQILRSQIVTSSWGGQRYLPYAFTEQGVAMLSSVLNSEKAIKVNIQIIRTFVKLREILLTNKELKNKIQKLEKKYDQQFKIIFEAIKQLISPQKEPANEIGFRIKNNFKIQTI